MATPSSSGTLLLRVANCVDRTLFQHVAYAQRISTCYEQRRYRKRSRTPAWWLPKRLVDYGKTNEQLTSENKAFLREVVEDQYLEKLASPLREPPWPRNDWNISTTMRTGVLGVKIGVLPQWKKDGTKFMVTLIQIIDNHVINYVPPEVVARHPYWSRRFWAGRYGSVVVGAMSDDPFKYSREYNQVFAASGMPTKRRLTRFLVTPDAKVQPGTRLTANHFRVGDVVDVQARSIGHGFQGVVKRHGFKGGPSDARGSTKFHRRTGSIGGGSFNKVYKGKKMPGRMGFDWRILRGLTIHRINTKYNVLYVTGHCLPGPNHCYIRVMDTILPLRRRKVLAELGAPPMPTAYPEDLPDDQPEDIFEPDVFEMNSSTIVYEQEMKQKSAMKVKVKTKGKK